MKTKIWVLIVLLFSACTKQMLEEPQMSLSITNTLPHVVLSGNPINIEATTSGIPVGATNYKILLQVTSNDGKLLGSPFAPDAIAPNSNNKSIFDISGLVDEQITLSFASTPALINRGENLFNITVDVGERYINNSGEPVTNWAGINKNILVLDGKATKHQVTVWNKNSSSFYKEYIEARKFITIQPAEKTTVIAAPEKLWWMHDPQSTNKGLFLLITAYYSDNSTEVIQGNFDGKDLKSAVMTLPGDLLECNPFGFEFEIPEGETIEKVTARVAEGDVDDHTPLSPEVTYIIDNDFYEENNYILYKNRYGAIDPLWCTGECTEKHSPTSVFAQVPQSMGALPGSRTIEVSSKTITTSYELSTGYKSKEEIFALQDFVASTQMWLIKDGIEIPVYLKDKDHVVKQLSRNLNDIEFTLHIAHE